MIVSPFRPALSVVALIGMTIGCAAQPLIQWQATFGGTNADTLYCASLAGDGGYFLGGSSSSSLSGNKTNASFGASDYWLVKVDASGARQWDRVFGGTGSDAIKSLLPTSDGGCLVGGISYSGISGNKETPNYGNNDYWLIKVDANGGKEWEQSYGGDGYDWLCALCPAGEGYLLAGYSDSGASGNKTSPSFGRDDYWIVKVDAGGNKLWESSFGGTNYDFLYAVEPSGDGGFLLAGSSQSGVSGNKTNGTFGSSDGWLVQVAANGEKQWERSFGGSGAETLWSVRPTGDGGYVLGATSTSGISGNKTSPGYGGNDYWLVKVDGGGNKQWDKTFGGNLDDYCGYAESTGDGGVLAFGDSVSDVSGNKTARRIGNGDLWFIKVDVNGSKQWEQVFGGTLAEGFRSARATPDGGCVVGAVSYSGVSGNKTTAGFGGADFWTIKLRPPVTLESLLVADNRFSLRVNGLIGHGPVVVHASTNLQHWSPILTNQPAVGSLDVPVAVNSDWPCRYYRVEER